MTASKHAERIMLTDVTAEELRALFHYDPLTGIFTNISRRGNCVKIGCRAGSLNAKGYRTIKIKQRGYKAHRLAILYVTGEWPVGEVDHINGDKDDNRIENLRCADGYVNQQNKRKPKEGTAAGFLGVSRGGWKGRRWVAEIRHNGERTYLGIFQTPEAAHAAYLDAKRRLHQGCTI